MTLPDAGSMFILLVMAHPFEAFLVVIAVSWFIFAFHPRQHPWSHRR